VIAGHGRLSAAKLLHIEKVPVITLENLTEQQRRAYVIADNRLSEVAEWNEDLLGEQLKILSEANLSFSLESIGFEVAEVDMFIENLTSASDCRSPKFCSPEISIGYGVVFHRQTRIVVLHDRHPGTPIRHNSPPLSHALWLASRNLVLRQQLVALKRRRPKPRLAVFDKMFWVLARRFWSEWKQALMVLSPETVVRWHRSGFALYFVPT